VTHARRETVRRRSKMTKIQGQEVSLSATQHICAPGAAQKQFHDIMPLGSSFLRTPITGYRAAEVQLRLWAQGLQRR
jgi:hypothetical protein